MVQRMTRPTAKKMVMVAMPRRADPLRAVTVATKRVLPRSARMVVYRQAAAGKR